MTRSRLFLARAVLVAGVTGAGLVPMLPAAVSAAARRTDPAECVPCGDPADCAPSGLRTAAAPRCVEPPPDTQPDDGNLVSHAQAGWEAVVSAQPKPEPGADYLPIPECPFIDVADIGAAFDAQGLLRADLPELTASIGVELADEGEPTPNVNLMCESRADDDDSGRAISETGILVTVLPDGTSVADLPFDADELVAAEPSEALLGGAMSGYCAESRPGAYCYQIWSSGQLLIMLFAGAPGGDPSSLPAVGDTLTDLLPAVLERLGSYASD